MTQINMDRIVRIEFNRIEDGSAIVSRYLYCELLPSAPNIILTQDGTILDACIHSRKEDRTVLPQVEYTLPKNSGRMNFMEFSEAELRNVLDYPSTEDDDTAPSILFRLFNGLNRQVVEKICTVANIGYDDLYSTLTGEGKDKLAHALYNVAQEIGIPPVSIFIPMPAAGYPGRRFPFQIPFHTPMCQSMTGFIRKYPAQAGLLPLR